ncbi:MAG: glycosyltransferase family 4 protein [Chthoniobacterales bacterium]
MLLVPELAYLFERFPSFGQHFIYREVAELARQGVDAELFSIRQPLDEPAENWDAGIVRRVHYLPEQKQLVAEIERAIRAGELPAAAASEIREWGRQTDFLRLYQAAYVGMRLRRSGVRRVHAHFAGMAARTAFWIRRFFGLGYSFTAHANDIFVPRDFVVSVARLIESAEAVLTVSDFAVGALQERYPNAAKKIHRIYNGIDVSAFPLATFHHAVAKIVSIGRLIEKKGFRDLIDACAILARKGAVFSAEIIGEGPLESDLRGRIAQHGLESKVSLPGPLPQSEIAPRLATATMFVLPCRTEATGGTDNLPTVIMEAMAAGLPVVSTRVAGVPEMVADGQTGLLVSEGDVTGLASAMATIANDQNLARTLGTRGRQVAIEKFSIDKNVAQLRQILGARTTATAERN